MYLKIGQNAPDFSLPDYNDNMVSLNDFQNMKVLIWFFPKASTPGWTIQGCGFRDEYQNYKNKKITVIGVSADAPKKQKKFVEKYNFPFVMLCDESKVMIKSYKAFGLKKFMGREYEGIHRISYLINEDKNIEQVYGKVKTKTHAQDVLLDLWLKKIF